MPFLLDRRTFFVHIARTGGTSIEKAMGNPHRGKTWNVPEVDRKSKIRNMYGNIDGKGKRKGTIELDHATADMITELVDPADLAASLKFTVVRNPYDRLVSCYRHDLRGPFSGKTFPKFIRELHKRRDDLDQMDHWVVSHLVPQCRMTKLPGLRILRTETLAADWQLLCRDLRHPSRPLPRCTAGECSPERPKWTKQLADLVWEIYQEDFTTHGYARDSWADPGMSNIVVDARLGAAADELATIAHLAKDTVWPVKVNHACKVTVLVEGDANVEGEAKCVKVNPKGGFTSNGRAWSPGTDYMPVVRPQQLRLITPVPVISVSGRPGPKQLARIAQAIQTLSRWQLSNPFHIRFVGCAPPASVRSRCMVRVAKKESRDACCVIACGNRENVTRVVGRALGMLMDVICTEKEAIRYGVPKDQAVTDESLAKAIMAVVAKHGGKAARARPAQRRGARM